MLKRSTAILITLAAWGAIYLPFLATEELADMEPLRIAVAMNMVHGGSLIVPHLGDAAYYNKPPGQNWPMAAAFYLAGKHTEFLARLPSALAVLIVALMFLVMKSGWMDDQGAPTSPSDSEAKKPLVQQQPDMRLRLILALVFMSCIGIVCVGRRAEIDGLYSCISAMAMLWWLNIWSRGGNRWWLWIPAGLLLAYGRWSRRRSTG